MKTLNFDAADIRILSAIQTHGMLSKAKLAECVNLSPTACWGRLSALKKAGLIKGQRGIISLDRLAEFSKVVVTVSLSNHKKADFERFESFVKKRDEVTDCIATGGGTDYVMTIITPNLKDFQDLVEEMLAGDLGIERYMTYIVTREIKSSPPNLERLIKAD